MRILIAVDAPLDERLGGAQVAIHLARALGERGHRVDLRSIEPAASPLHPRLRWWGRRRLLAALLRGAEYDLVDAPAAAISGGVWRRHTLLVRSTQPEILYQQVARRARAATHGPLTRAVDRLSDSLFLRATLNGWRRASRILALGSDNLEWMRSSFPKLAPKLGRWVNAPSPAERARLEEVRKRRDRREAPYRLLWIGRWSAHKRPDRVVRLAEESTRRGSPERFTIAGCGSLPRDAIPSHLLANGKLTLTPQYDRDELFPLLASHDAGLFTSETEGWGLSLNEMLESGLPVYATRVGAVPDLERFFPSMLRPFPPDLPLRELPPPEPPAPGYEDLCSWPAIAAAYEDEAASAIGLPGRGGSPTR